MRRMHGKADQQARVGLGDVDDGRVELGVARVGVVDDGGSGGEGQQCRGQSAHGHLVCGVTWQVSVLC